METNDKDKIYPKTDRKKIHIEIGDNLYWLLLWFGVFILMFFGKC